MTSKSFYVYAYLREKDNTPYYIGKGIGRRAWCKARHTLKVPDKLRIVIMETNLTEIGAFALERFYIRWYGRKDLGTGILRNLTDGGEGVSGYRHSEEYKQTRKPLSEETKRKMSESHKKIDHRPPPPIKGSKQSIETIERKVKAVSRTWEVTFSDGKIETVFNLADFCRKYNLNRSMMSEVAGGRFEQYKGFKVRKI